MWGSDREGLVCGVGGGLVWGGLVCGVGDLMGGLVGGSDGGDWCGGV